MADSDSSRENGPLREDERNEIRRRYASGESAKSVAAAFGKSECTIFRLTEDLRGLHGRKPMSPRRAPFTKDEIAIIRARYVAGEASHVLAHVYGCSRNIIIRHAVGLHETRRFRAYERILTHLTGVDVGLQGWCAGIVDGEGCITLHRVNGREAVAVTVAVGSTTPEMARRLQEIVGYGTVRVRSRVLNRKHQTTWTLTATERVRAFLEWIRPYLVVKPRVADLVLEHCRSRMAPGVWHSPRTARENEINIEVGKLNHRGTNGDH